jgi:Mn-containing catalase
MHQNQWHAALEEMGETVPVPASFPQEKENEEFNYEFMSTFREDRENPNERWTEGVSIDGKDEFSFGTQPGGGNPQLEKAVEEMYNEASGGSEDSTIEDSE